MSVFDRLPPKDFTWTSDATNDYNCVAWGLHDDENVWDPIDGMWRDDVEKGWTPAHFVKLFMKEGYTICDSSDHEPGMEKIAIYHENLAFRHIARQKDDGVWTSKMGGEEDIDHVTLEVLKPVYGDVFRVMKRAFL